MSNLFKTIFDIENSNLTDYFKSYLKIKLENPDCAILFRNGEFYEAYFEDAKLVSSICQIALSSRKTNACKVPLAGFGKSSSLTYIKKLLDNNYKVALCEEFQINDKKIRTLTKKYTSGTVLEDELLTRDKNNFIGAVLIKENQAGFSYCDVSTGEFFITQGKLSEIKSEVFKIFPSELLISQECKECHDLFSYLNLSKIEASTFREPQEAKQSYKLGYACASAILDYTKEAQKELMPNLENHKTYSIKSYLTLNQNARKSLEIVKNMTNDKKFGTLFWVLDETKTPMGRRLLEKYINEPLVDIKEITARQEAIGELIENKNLINKFDEILENINDLMRNSIKISNATTNKKIFCEIKDSLKYFCTLGEISKNFASKIINFEEIKKTELKELLNLLEKNISEDFQKEEIIKEGANPELDYLREKLNNLEKELGVLEEKYALDTNIKNLKIINHKSMGYLIEVPSRKQKDFGENYFIKQLLSTTARLQTKELIELEKEINSTKDKEKKLEKEIFKSVQDFSKKFFSELYKLSEKIAKFDVILSLAKCAIKNNYTRPEISTNSSLNMKNGAHPALIKKSGKFDRNSIAFNDTKPNFKLLTGPNMAGKSTFMRELAHIIIMFQIGSYVPCEWAKLPITTQIFVRFGINDNLIKNNSSFMVEMNDMKEIIENSDYNSLILIDELGKSTASADGIAISRAISEYIIEKLDTKTIFATHYHELKILKEKYANKVDLICVNFNNKGERVLSEGFLDKSFGIEVAKIANLPKEIIEKAQSYIN